MHFTSCELPVQFSRLTSVPTFTFRGSEILSEILHKPMLTANSTLFMEYSKNYNCKIVHLNLVFTAIKANRNRF